MVEHQIVLQKNGENDGRAFTTGKNELYFWGIEKKSGKTSKILD